MAIMKKAEVTAIEGGLRFVNEAGTREVLIEGLKAEVLEKALLHGLKQKICDSYSGLIGGREVFAAIEAVIAGLEAGTWNAGRSSNGGIWVEALSRASGKALELCLEKWTALDEEGRKNLKAHPGLKQAKAEIELEKAKAKAGGFSDFEF